MKLVDLRSFAAEAHIQTKCVSIYMSRGKIVPEKITGKGRGRQVIFDMDNPVNKKFINDRYAFELKKTGDNLIPRDEAFILLEDALLKVKLCSTYFIKKEIHHILNFNPDNKKLISGLLTKLNNISDEIIRDHQGRKISRYDLEEVINREVSVTQDSVTKNGVTDNVTTMTVCQNCGKKFKSTRKTARFCSANCRVHFNRYRVKEV